MNDGLREQLRRVAVDLGPELSSVVFTGGAVVGVYLDESYGSEVRYTRDVDVVHAAATRMDYYSLEARLRERGWAQSMGDDDPICRWISPSQVVVDVMAVDPDALGFTNRWYRAGFDAAISIDLGAGLNVAVFESAVFLATICVIPTRSMFGTLLLNRAKGSMAREEARVGARCCGVRRKVIRNVGRCVCRVTFCIMQREDSSKVATLVRMAQEGPVRARDLDEAGIPRAYLGRLCDRGLLERVDRGLYRLAEGPMTELGSLAEVSKRVPRAVVCLLSALQVHGMTSEAPHAVWLLIDRHARMPRLSSPMIEVVRASGEALEHGVETRVIDGVPVPLTTPAKTVADCFRFRRHVGLEVALDALRDYLRRRVGSVDALVEAARADRIYGVMRPYLEALA